MTRETAEAFRPLRDHILRTLDEIRETWRPITEWAQTPEGQAQLAAWRADREAEEARQDNTCMCLCSVVHGGEAAGVCVGQATTTAAHWSETTGRVDVPVCDECAEARREGVTA